MAERLTEAQVFAIRYMQAKGQMRGDSRHRRTLEALKNRGLAEVIFVIPGKVYRITPAGRRWLEEHDHGG